MSEAAGTTIESLQIEIQGNATSAAGGIDVLSESLRKLKAATAPVSKGGMGLSTLSNSLQKFNNSISGLSGLSLAKGQMRGIADALKPLEKVQKSGFGSLASGLDKLVKVAPQLGTVTTALKNTDLDAFAEQCNRVATAITPLATQMEKVAAGFSAFPAKIQRLLKGNTSLSASNSRLGLSYAKLAAKISMAYLAITRIARVVGSWISKSNQYVEDLNLFTASMGEYAAEAKRYAETVAEIIGIDPSEWLRNQGIFMTITKGFGVVSDRAYTMSQNLTQLGYDISSFFNISFADAFQKLQSGIAGELEPLRRLGYDLSVARLQQEALNLGIEKSVNAMTQAEKAELRYYAIMTQVTVAQGDMARTLVAPANQLRILKAQITQCVRALGNIFIPALNAVLPYAIALAKAIRFVADAIASFFDFALPEIDYSGLSGAAGGAEDVADSLGDATEKARELKNALLGIDELNVISPPEDSGSGGGADIGGGGGLGFDLPTYDFIGEAISTKVDEIMKKLEPLLTWIKDNVDEILAGVMAIGGAFLAWKIAKGVIKALEWLSTMKDFNVFGSVGFKITGLGLFLDAWNTVKEAIQDIMENGANFTNVTKLISGFAEGLGAAFLLFGRLDLAAPMLIISGVAGIISDISDMVNNGVNWENAMSLTKNLGLFLSGIGLVFKDYKLGGIGLIISGVSLLLENLKALVNGFKTGDFSNVEWIEVVSGALLLVGGLIIAFKKIEETTKGANLGGAKAAIDTVKTTTEGVSGSVGQLSTKLTSLAKNLGMGIVIIGEVAIAAGLITSAIWGLGLLLEQVGIAWQPVIDNGGTVAAAMGLGVAVLTAVGVVTALLGSVGTPLIVNIALGTAILAELGVATGLFIIEIWAIGKGLDEIGKAWQPVLDNGETIATGIGLGTALLIGIGVVTAALGVATVATAGLLPLAIGLGTALLVELAAAVVLFIESLVVVADELSNKLSPALDDLNGKLPDLTNNMSDFVDFMTAFAGEVVRYTGASAVAGLSATIDTIIGWFTQDPIEKMSKDVDKIAGQASDLNEKLNVAIPELETAVDLLGKYVTFVDELGKVAGSGGTVNLSEGLKVNLKTVGENIVTGFNDGIKNKYSTIKSTITDWGKDVQTWFTNSSNGGINKDKWSGYANDIINGFKDKISSSSSNSKSSMTSWASNVKSWFTNKSYGGVNKETFQGYGSDIITGFNNGVTKNYDTAKSGITSFANTVKNAFTAIVSYDAFYDVAEDVVKGFNKGINDFYDLSRPYMRKWANDAKKTFKKELDSNSPSKVFERIGGDTVLGYNLGVMKLGKTTRGVVTSWANSFTSVSPVMSFAVDTSALRYYSSDSFAKSISANVTSNSSVAVTGFKEGMEEFYREYIEPTMAQMAEDMRRQADKNEQTIVQIGNRTVSDAVITRQKANGYAFAK